MAGYLLKPPASALIPLAVRSSQVRGLSDTSWFGPLQPLKPMAPEGTQPRQQDYEPGANLNFLPRSTEPISFADLIYMADNCDIVRVVIEALKDQVSLLPWQIRVKEVPNESQKQRGERQKNNPKVAAWTEFLQWPNADQCWADWVRMLLEDLLVLDAPSILLQRTRAKKIGALRVIDGQTISRIIDVQGFTPLAPNPAYQQVLFGMPAIDLTTDDLVYRPRNQRARKRYGCSPVEQVLMTLNIAIRRTRFQLNYYCYSDDTEVLTKRGWLKFSDTTEQDEFATRRINAGIFEWQKATEHFCKWYDGDMIHFSGQSTDILVTPNHRMLVDTLPRALGRGKPLLKGEHVVSAEDLMRTATNNTKIPTTSVWTGREIKHRRWTPRSGWSHSEKKAKPVKMTGDQYCAFMGMYLAEGSIKTNCNGERTIVQIHQPEDARGSHALYSRLLADIFGSVPYFGNERTFEISRRCLAVFLGKFGHAHEKYVPQDILNATPRQLKIFWDYYYAGDGAVNGSGAFTVSRRLADQLTEVLQKMGMSHTTWIRKAGVARVGTRTVSQAEGYSVRSRRAKFAGAWESTRVKYHGNVCCVVVPNKFLYVRRNGKAAWCGNTEGNVPEALYTMPANVTEDNVRKFQSWFDSQLQGDLAARRRVWFIPGDDKGVNRLHWTKEQLLKDEADEWFARIICFAFRISPKELVKAMNRASAVESQDSSEEMGVMAIAQWVADTVNYIIQRKAGDADVEFAFSAKREADILKQAQADKIYVDSGVKERNEVREDLGLDPSSDPMANVLGVVTVNGFTPLDQIEHVNAQAQANTDASRATADDSEPRGGNDNAPAPKENQQQKLAKAITPIGTDTISRTDIAQLEATVASFLKTTGDKVADQVAVILAAHGVTKSDEPEKRKKLLEEILDVFGAIEWTDLVSPVESSLFQASATGGSIEIAQLKIANVALISAVSVNAREFASKRAAELVGMKRDANGSLIANPSAKWRIDKTTREELTGIVTKAFSEETPMAPLVEKIRNAGAFGEARSKMIAATEINRAQSLGQIDVWKRIGTVKTVRWDLSADHEDMDQCDLNHAHGAVELGKEFPSGDICPPAHPRCMCSLAISEINED